MLNKYFVSKQKEFNDDDRTLVAWATTDDVDRDGEVLSADGWDLKSFKKNPVLMACHDYWKFPIGRVIWVKPDPPDKPKGLKFKAQFAETDEGLDAWYLYRNGYMNAFSVGFDPLEEPIYDDKADGKKKPRRTYPRNELLEISCVPVPANASALVEAEKSMKTKAFKDIIENIKQMATPDQVSKIWDQALVIQNTLKEIGAGYVVVSIDRIEISQSDTESGLWGLRSYSPNHKQKHDAIDASEYDDIDIDELDLDELLGSDRDALGETGDISEAELAEILGDTGDDADLNELVDEFVSE